jgi:hypothetical protein
MKTNRFFDSAVERDAQDMRETADLLDRLKYHENALWLRRVAARHEVIAGAYRTADAARAAACDFFAWFNRHYPVPSTNESHEYNRLAKHCWPPSAEEVAEERARGRRESSND